MANNYLQFSVIYDIPEGCDAEKSLEIAQAAAKGSLDDDMLEEFEDGDACDGVDISLDGDSIWFCAEEAGEPSVVASAVEALQEHWKDDRLFTMSWAYTCSKMRADEFGGGALACKLGKDTVFVDALQQATKDITQATDRLCSEPERTRFTFCYFVV